ARRGSTPGSAQRSATPPIISAKAALASTSWSAGMRASSTCSASSSASMMRATTTRRNGSMWSSWPGRATARSISTAANLQLKGARAYPKPYGNTRPLLMNAGSSDVGQAFGLRNCDAFLVATAGSRTSLEGNAAKVVEIKAAAAKLGRQIEVFTVGQVICRPSQQEAEDYYRHVNIEHADW